MLGWIASGIYSKTIGAFWSGNQTEKLPAQEEYVCVDYLDRQAD
jgi:hypothetical protein